MSSDALYALLSYEQEQMADLLGIGWHGHTMTWMIIQTNYRRLQRFN